MIPESTFKALSEVATKTYDLTAQTLLDKLLNAFARETSPEVVKQLVLPNVLMFFASTIAKCQNHQTIDAASVNQANAFLRYILSRERVDQLLENEMINIGLPESDHAKARLILLT